MRRDGVEGVSVVMAWGAMGWASWRGWVIGQVSWWRGRLLGARRGDADG